MTLSIEGLLKLQQKRLHQNASPDSIKVRSNKAPAFLALMLLDRRKAPDP